MRVVFLEDVAGVAHGGDVREVKNGFARNYLLPKKLAVPATHNALQRVEGLSQQASVKREKEISDMQVLAEQVEGVQINIEMRAGANGRLYGSVTNAIIAERLSEQIGQEIDRRIVEIPDSIRELGTFDVSVRFHHEVQAGIKVLVYPIGTDPKAVVEVEDAEEGEEVEGGEPESATAEAPEAVEDSAPVAEVESEDEDEAEAESPEDEDVEEETESEDEPEDDEEEEKE